ncbi:MAG: hypothetical protein NC394_06955 [Bacteroides sp.]|nr:hypothetical protein [Bacteroides sp.]
MGERTQKYAPQNWERKWCSGTLLWHCYQKDFRKADKSYRCIAGKHTLNFSVFALAKKLRRKRGEDEPQATDEPFSLLEKPQPKLRFFQKMWSE